VVQQKKQYIVDEKGRKTAIVVSLKEYQQLLQDLHDLSVIAERKTEPSENLETVKKRLEKKWATTKSR